MAFGLNKKERLLPSDDLLPLLELLWEKKNVLLESSLTEPGPLPAIDWNLMRYKKGAREEFRNDFMGCIPSLYVVPIPVPPLLPICSLPSSFYTWIIFVVFGKSPETSNLYLAIMENTWRAWWSWEQVRPELFARHSWMAWGIQKFHTRKVFQSWQERQRLFQ